MRPELDNIRALVDGGSYEDALACCIIVWKTYLASRQHRGLGLLCVYTSSSARNVKDTSSLESLIDDAFPLAAGGDPFQAMLVIRLYSEGLVDKARFNSIVWEKSPGLLSDERVRRWFDLARELRG